MAFMSPVPIFVVDLVFRIENNVPYDRNDPIGNFYLKNIKMMQPWLELETRPLFIKMNFYMIIILNYLI